MRDASSCECVTMTMAVPRSRFSSSNMPQIGVGVAGVEVAGGFVGEHAGRRASPAHVRSRRAGVRRRRAHPACVRGDGPARPLQQSVVAHAHRARRGRDRRISSGIATFSSAVNSGSRWWNWYTKPSASLRKRPRAACRDSAAHALARHGDLAALGTSSPPSRCSSVLLPAPEAPMIATASPARTAIVDAGEHLRFDAGFAIGLGRRRWRRDHDARRQSCSFVAQRLDRMRARGAPGGIQGGDQARTPRPRRRWW
jgi:hypothetical protein